MIQDSEAADGEAALAAFAQEQDGSTQKEPARDLPVSLRQRRKLYRGIFEFKLLVFFVRKKG